MALRRSYPSIRPYTGTDAPSGEGKHFWKIPSGIGSVNAGLQADLRDIDSGIYSFDMNAGIQLAVPRTVTTVVQESDGSSSIQTSVVQRFVGTTSKSTVSEGDSRLVHVNTVNSAFGSGWGIAGVQELKEGYDESILIIDGDGTELLFNAPTGSDGIYGSPVGDFSTLERLEDGTFRRTSKEQTVYSFDISNRLVSVVDRNGNQTQHIYDDAGQLVTIVDPAGLETTFLYNEQGKVSQIIDPANRVTALVYDDAGNLLSIQDPDSAQRTFKYDDGHHMTGEVDQRGNQEKAYYDEFGRATYADRKDGSSVSLQAVQTRNLYSPEKTTSLFNAPDAFRNRDTTATYIDGNGNVTKTELDNAGQLVDSFDRGGQQRSVIRDTQNLIAETVSGRGFTTKFDYDDSGNVTSIIDTPGTSTSSLQDVENRSLSLDGIDDFAQLSNSSIAGGLPNSTVEMWIRSDDLLGGGQTIYSEDNYGGTVHYIPINSQKISFNIWRTGGSPSNWTFLNATHDDTGVESGTWAHVAAVLSQTEGRKLYINGELAAVDSENTLPTNTSVISAALGRFTNDGGGGYFDGQIDEVRVWDYARSIEEIQATQYTSFGRDQRGLIGYWNFDQADGNVVADLSRSGRDAVLMNGATLANDGAPFTEFIPNDTIFFDDFERGARSEWSNSYTTSSGSFTRFSGRFGNQDQTLSLETTPGETYTLYFDSYNIDSWDGSSDEFSVSVNNETVFNTTFPYSSTYQDLQPATTGSNLGFSFWGDTIYRDIEIEFTAESELTQIKFSASNLALNLGDESWGIDNVEVARKRDSSDREIGTREYTYDNIFNQLTSAIDERGNLTLYDIDETTGDRTSMTRVVGDIDSVINGETDDITTAYTYTAQGLIDTLTDALGRVTDYDYDALGRLSQTTFAVGTENEARQQFEYDAAGNLTAFTNENGNRTEYIYDALNRVIQTKEADPDDQGPLASPWTGFDYDESGNLTATTDARGNQTQYVYDERDRLTELIDANGDRTQYTYDASGNLVSLVEALDRETRYEYDSRDRRTAIIDPEGNKTRFRYDLDNNLSAVIDSLGNRTSYAYDARNRLVRETDALGNVTAYVYDATNNLVGQTDRRGNVTEYGYDALNRLTRVIDALGSVATLGYDKLGNLLNSSDERGNVTAYAYDERNRLAQLTDALGSTIGYTYDGVGNQLSMTDELARTTTYAYDALNRLTQMTDALNHSTTYGYDAFDNLTGVTDALGRTTAYSYDNLNRQVQMVDAAGGTSSYTYDAVGNLTAYTDELARTTTYEYDERNLQSKVSDPLGNATVTTYDAVGNVATITDALNNTTQYTYDALYRRTKVTDALGKETAMVYDAEGNLLSLTDASDNVTDYTYDVLNRMATESITVEGEALTRRYDYDATSNLIERADRNGRTQTFTYDALNRQTQEQWLDEQGNAVRAISYSYDAASQLTAVNDPDSAYGYSYDAAGRLTSVDNSGTAGSPDVLLNYGYDAVNNRTSVTDFITGIESGIETFDYDALDRVTQITQRGNGVAEKRVNMTYDAASQMTGLQRYSDLAGTQSVADTVYTYDGASRLTDLDHERNGTAISDYGFTYDAANRLTQLITPDGTSDYSYNGRDELTTTGHSYQEDEGYSYDDTGNRTNEGYGTGDHNRLLTNGTYTYEYDNEGNRTRRVEVATGEVTDYGWDHRNRMTSVVTKNSGGAVIKAVEYTYDVYDRRIAKAVDSDGDGAAAATEERYVYDGEHIALVFDGEGNQLSRYLHGPQVDQVLAEETAAGDVRWALSDHQSSVRDLVDSEGTVLNHLTYDSYGQVTNETNPEVDFRFGYTGRERDEETGLYYYRARYFDPAVGTFVSEDPLGFGAGDSNVYRYVFNSPTNYVDPSGLFSVWVRGSLVNKGKEYKHRTVRGGGSVSEATGQGNSIDSGDSNPGLQGSFGSTTVGIGSAGSGKHTRTQLVTPDLGLINPSSPLAQFSGTVAWGQNSTTGNGYFEAGLALNTGIAGSGFTGTFDEFGPIDFGLMPVPQREDSRSDDTRGQGFGIDTSGIVAGLAFGIGFGIGFGFSAPVVGISLLLGVGYSIFNSVPGMAAEPISFCFVQNSSPV